MSLGTRGCSGLAHRFDLFEQRFVDMKRKRKRYALLILVPLAFGVMRGVPSAHAAEGQPAQSETTTPPGEKGGTCCKAGDATPPTELVKQVPKGQLHSPYPDYAKLAKDDPDLVKQFRLPGCNEWYRRRWDLPSPHSRRLVLG